MQEREQAQLFFTARGPLRGSAGEKFVVVALVAEGAMYLLTMMETSCGHWAKSRRAKATYRYLYTYVHI